MSVGESQPVEGAAPPSVVNRWMTVVLDSVLPPVGPSWAPTTWSNTQGIAPALTKSGSREDAIARAHTVLVSTESSQVARTVSLSNGLGLKKWVVSCAPWSLNNVACGVNRVQATRPIDFAG